MLKTDDGTETTVIYCPENSHPQVSSDGTHCITLKLTKTAKGLDLIICDSRAPSEFRTALKNNLKAGILSQDGMPRFIDMKITVENKEISRQQIPFCSVTFAIKDARQLAHADPVLKELSIRNKKKFRDYNFIENNAHFMKSIQTVSFFTSPELEANKKPLSQRKERRSAVFCVDT